MLLLSCWKAFPLMRLPKPQAKHSPEVYQAIVQEHHGDPVRMAERLQSCGWGLADAAWAAVHWDITWLAAAIANERAKRATKPTNLSECDLARLRAEIGATQKPPHPPRPKRTARIMRTTPRLPQRPPKRADEPKA